MLWPREHFRVAFKQVVSDAIDTHGASVLLLVALDVDSIAAVSILTSLLQSEMVAYSMVPVAGYKQMANMVFSTEIRSIFLINCGAMIDVYSTLKITDQKVYVIDSHRPLHLANVYDRHGTVVLFDDEGQAEGDFPDDGSDIAAIEQEEEDDDDADREIDSDDDDSEAEADLTDTATARGKRKRTESNGSLTSDDGGDDGEGADDGNDVDEPGDSTNDPDRDDEGGHAVNMDEPRSEDEGSVDNEAQDGEPEVEQVPPAAFPDKHLPSKRKRRLDILQYYRGSFHGAPAATLVYELASQLNMATQEKVWYAIVGLTKQFVAQQIDADNYNMLVQKFQDEVLALPANGGSNDIVTDVDGTILPTVQNGAIAFEEEYRFMLYRHWSLYESMYYSNYVAAKLKTWQAAGKDELEVFLARMGLSLKECQQRFTFMSRELKQTLRDKCRDIAPEFGLDELFYGSFRRQFEFKYQWCAADVFHGLSALLDAPLHVAQKALADHVPDALQGIYDEPTETSGDGAPSAPSLPYWQHSFHLAMDALPCSSTRSCVLMERGMHMAMQLQQAIVHLGISILDRKLLVRVKHFRYVCLRLSEEEELLFSHPSTLSKLALFLVDVHREQGKWIGKHAAPFVLVAHVKARNVYLVVGVTCPERAGDIHRNTLGTAFALAAAETGALSTYDGFETTVMELRMDDIHVFIEQLHNVMDA
ncbi:hypothetical protein H310_08180 [Aphanomyces invadans]|uniref:CDC45-like protein n=1 Tax=Aphanomyces invadans TaxID=157072 RepID=A0A024U0U2_9STRA|nr:hypothetical protein H310_08180 [Aphanomyces invadans]ETV99506.1 hypothetical protein H310_08180 [Aphanomyces invadans]|eukprot:XP_008872062.1 hypothetical protein H310_08180 [Aphanomyces invadans]